MLEKSIKESKVIMHELVLPNDTIVLGLICVTFDKPIGDKHNSPKVIKSHPITNV